MTNNEEENVQTRKRNNSIEETGEEKKPKHKEGEKKKKREKIAEGIKKHRKRKENEVEKEPEETKEITIEEQTNNKQPPQARTFVPIQRPVEEEKKKDKKGFLGLFGRKKKEAHEMEIGGVISFSHEGHAGFDKDKGGLQTEGLPPALQEFFNKLDDTMKSLGFDGVTQKEMKIVLKKFGHLIIQDQSATTPTPVEEKPLTYDEISIKLRDNEVQMAGMKATLNTLQQAKAKFQKEVEELNQRLQEERKTAQEMMKENTDLKFQLAKYKESSGGSEELQGSTTLLQLEETMKQSLDEVNQKLHAEQQRVRALQEQLQTVTDEKDHIAHENHQLLERLRQNETTPLSPPIIVNPHLPHPSTLPPPPPPPSVPSSMIAPPPPPPPGPPIAPQSQPQNQNAMGLAIGSVQLKKTEVVQRPPPADDPKSELLSAIRGGTTLKHVDVQEHKPKESDDNVLNLIARALIDRRARIKVGDDDDDDSDNGDWDD